MSVVWLVAVKDAAKNWYDQGDDLDGAKRSLSKADLTTLTPPVRGAALGFVEHWSSYIQNLTDQANEHGGSLNDAADNWQSTDEREEAKTRELLPWADRDLPYSPPHLPEVPR